MQVQTVRIRPVPTGPVVRDVAPFVALTFGISWGLWAVALTLGGDIAAPAVFALYALGGCGPSLAAGILRLLGRPGVGQARLRTAPGWLPVSVLVGAAPTVVGALVATSFGAAPFDPAALDTLVAQAGGLLPLLGVLLVAGPLAEEFGWRGYLQPHLRRALSPARTTLIVGVIWAAWHVPLFLLVGTSQSAMGLVSPAAAVFFVAMVPLSVGYWFVSERLRGGVPAAVLVHLTGNFSLALLMTLQSVAGGVAFVATAAVLAGVLLIGSRRDRPSPS